jgi:sigma-B regulation protein RsbU (phosphoserine phosphatase)
LQGEHELDSARRVQKHLYPDHAPSVTGLDIAGAVFSATRACGDYYDYIRTDDETVFVAVGDVSGHGLGPALHMVETRAYLRAILANTQVPGQALTELNTLLLEDILDDAFVTLLLAKFETRHSTLVYSGAGHEARLMRGGTQSEPLPSTGLVLGVMPDAAYGNSGPIRLQPGDIVLILTDGFMETRAANRAFFGWEGVENVVRRNRQLTAERIIAALHDAAQLFSGHASQADDMTAVVIKAT